VPAYYIRAWQEWKTLWCTVTAQPDPEIPPQKQFKPKFPVLKQRTSYRGIFEEEWWNDFPLNLTCPTKSLIKAKELGKLANSLGCSDKEQLRRVIDRIDHGSNIGCNGIFRHPTVSTNAPSAYQYGREVTDAIAAWVVKGFAYGPVDKSSVPPSAKINGIMVRPKPNGSARIILNLSAPKGNSVNDGIDADDFPTSMSSTEAWLKVLHKAGRNCWISKTDWSDAYKHFAVRDEDTNLQWFEWGDKYFKELSLIFGVAPALASLMTAQSCCWT